MTKSVENNEIVITGQFLGVVEEFLPDKNSTYIKEGKIYSTKTGIASIDFKKRKIEIRTYQEKDRKVIWIGDEVIGIIAFIRQYSVGLRLYSINQKLLLSTLYFGNIHVSQISNKYVEKISEAFQKTDIVRAHVIEQKAKEYSLSTVGQNLGVIHTDCVMCGTPLDKIGFNKLKCERCGNIENRKLASNYRIAVNVPPVFY